MKQAKGLKCYGLSFRKSLIINKCYDVTALYRHGYGKRGAAMSKRTKERVSRECGMRVALSVSLAITQI
jgi:hypothetical protein